MSFIVSTKKLIPSQERLLSLGEFSIFQHNFIDTEQKDFSVNTEKKYDFIIFTSQNAVEILEKSIFFENIKKIKVFCVGEKTKKMIENRGWKVLEYAHYGEDLAKIIIERYQMNSFLYFCGEKRQTILENSLQKANISVEICEVYHTMYNPVKIPDNTKFLLFFSPSAVESFLLKNEFNDEFIFCIGKSTAKIVSKYTNKYIICKTPTIENTIELCVNFIKNKDNVTK